MKTFITTVEIEFTCVEESMAHARVMGIPFGDHDCGFQIVGVREGKIDPAKDETLLPEYRELHGCDPVHLAAITQEPEVLKLARLVRAYFPKMPPGRR